MKNTKGVIDAEEDNLVLPEWQKELLNKKFYENKEDAHLNFEKYLFSIPQSTLFKKNITIFHKNIPLTNIKFLYTGMGAIYFH
ncbi:MAG: hypothetical protein LBV46_00645 [Bacteroidales bacterium]|nr:hypothetical protein [Bacteroidales bacterium]